MIEQITAAQMFHGDFASAQHPGNRSKNRYSNVLPPEGTRIRLKEKDNEGERDPTCDYINANMIRGLIEDSPTAYIATQGPLSHTCADFWRMVWEYDVCVIVMLTKEVENGRLKCDRYWPEPEGTVVAGTYTIVLDGDPVETEELTTRRMILTDTETSEERRVTQYQYTAWPDHNVPPSTAAYLDLSRQVDESNPGRLPIIVHCSAGIGRSGTFCTVHSIVEKLKRDLDADPPREPVFNIVNTVLHLREQRPGMVQTREQYIFCYVCIFEAYRQIMVSREPALFASQHGSFKSLRQASFPPSPPDPPAPSPMEVSLESGGGGSCLSRERSFNDGSIPDPFAFESSSNSLRDAILHAEGKFAAVSNGYEVSSSSLLDLSGPPTGSQPLSEFNSSSSLSSSHVRNGSWTEVPFSSNGDLAAHSSNFERVSTSKLPLD